MPKKITPAKKTAKPKRSVIRADKKPSAKDYAGREFVITREIAAPRALVFQAWTDPKRLAQWWGPRGFTCPVCEWNARPGKKIYVVMRAPNGTDYPMAGEFREIVAPERLVFTSGALDANKTLLFEFLHTLTLVERKGRTSLTLKSRVVKTTAGAGKYIGGFEAGMTQSLERLEKLLAAKSTPLVVERTFDAPVARVWKALTHKKEIAAWSFEMTDFQPKVGFKFEFDGEKGGVKYHHLCQVKEVIPRKKLAYSWRYQGQPGDSLVTIELAPAGKKTKLRLTHEGLESFPQTEDYARKNFEYGWTQLIGSCLKDFVEKGISS